MNIQVVAGIGRAKTLLSSFDDALRVCGVYNYNLIGLSSVVPTGATVASVDRHRPESEEDQCGWRLYVVRADSRSETPGDVVGAALGWHQWGDGRGVFVEHELIGATRDAVEDELRRRVAATLADLCAFRAVPFSLEAMGIRVVSAEVGDTPTTALALAVFKAEPW